MNEDPRPEPIQGFAAIPNWVVRETGVSGHAKLVYICLASRASRDGTTWPSHALIAKEARIGVTSVKAALAELKKLGLVSWERRTSPDGASTSNLYTLYSTAPPSRHTTTP